MGNLMRRRAMMAAASGGGDGPLYSLTDGSRKGYKNNTWTGNVGDVKVTNGNHFYFLKRWGDAAENYYGPLTVGESPFALTAGDTVRTILHLDASKTTGEGLKIVIGRYAKNSSSYNTVLVTGDKANGDSFEQSVTLTRSYPTTDLLILANPVENTAGKYWEGDIEMYVNDVRYI